jgi:hypothetical protein
MTERRTKRSPRPDEALQLLIEALADRSDVRAVALVNARGRVLAAAGAPTDIAGVARLARPIADGEEHPEFDAITEDTDFFTRKVEVEAVGVSSTVYLAALGTRLRRMQDTVNGIGRIVAAPLRPHAPGSAGAWSTPE